MNKQILFIILFIASVFVAIADENDSLKVSQDAFELIKLNNTWLNTSNPAGLHYNKGTLPGMLNLFYGIEDGDYKRVQEGDQVNIYSFQSKSYVKVKDVNLFGSFRYDKSYEKDLDYSNVNNPYRETPYSLIDTIGGDTYDREFFYIEGAMSLPMGESTVLGVSCDFGVGVAVQENDPRPQNKVLDLTFSPGIIHSFGKLSAGLNLIYQYYNEEVEIDIVEENTTATIFRTLGPGVYTYHEASSFNRLYKRNTMGAEGQFNYHNNQLDVILGAKGVYFKETAQDGGKGGDASWSYLRDYSEFEGIDWNIFGNLQVNKDLLYHRLSLNCHILTAKGTEVIENLEQVGNLDNEDWVFYMNEPKYYSNKLEADLNYDFIKMKSKTLKNYAFMLNVGYNSYEEEYHIPFQEQRYSNAVCGFEAQKTMGLRKTSFSVATGLYYKMNIDGEQKYEVVNFMNSLILNPDYEFLTDNYYAPVLNFSYERPLNKYFDKIFIDAKTRLLIGENGQSRMIANFSAGVTF